MLDNQKIRLMTRLAIYEKKHKISKNNITKNFKTDYVTYGMLRTMFAVTVAFLLGVGLFILYNAKEFMDKINSLDYAALGKMFFGYYCIVLVIYLTISLIVYCYKYDHSKGEVKRYLNNLKKLEKISDK